MIYLDYSATTPVNSEVLDSFNKACLQFVGNPNSLHKLGTEARNLINEATKQIAEILNVKESEIIYTSCASESNNLAIKGIALKYKNRGNHIITTPLEHSSIYGPLNYLQEQGFEVDFVNLTKDGLVDIDHLKSLIKDTTILVTINSVNSELGIQQPIDEIGKILKDYPKCFFHVDMTQSVGKVPVFLNNVDLATFAAHKFYGLKGIGVLIKKEKIMLEPLIHGGKSTTIFRSGTPALPLIVSLSKALRLIYQDFNSKYNHVKELNDYLREKLSKYKDIVINSNQYSIPHILNISVLGVKPETFLHALEEYDIYISTQSACSSETSISKAVYALTKDDNISSSSLRISLSYLTTKEEIDTFLKYFEICYNKLKIRLK
ncbi:MAG: cysteine desulfurase [Mollicutes bacterium]|nr:cysteine desulfurase [Mollicutes bacterium]